MLAWRLGLASPSLPGVLGAARWRPLVKTMCEKMEAGRRDKVTYYRYKADSARRALHGIDTQIMNGVWRESGSTTTFVDVAHCLKRIPAWDGPGIRVYGGEGRAFREPGRGRSHRETSRLREVERPAVELAWRCCAMGLVRGLELFEERRFLGLDLEPVDDHDEPATGASAAQDPRRIAFATSSPVIPTNATDAGEPPTDVSGRPQTSRCSSRGRGSAGLVDVRHDPVQ